MTSALDRITNHLEAIGAADWSDHYDGAQRELAEELLQLIDPTSIEIISWLDRAHLDQRLCPGCGEDASTSAFMGNAHYYVRCDCGHPTGPHYVEQLAHLACITGGSAGLDEAVTRLLESAYYVANRFKTGKPTADRIRKFLDRAGGDDD